MIVGGPVRRAGADSLLKYDVPILEANASKRNIQRDRKKGQAEEVELTREILDVLIPPRRFEEDDQVLVQFVSISPATRSDVVKLQTQLDALLTQRKARNTGICPVRSELYSQTFDEIIRQITIDCSARGKLLVRVRDEMRMTIQTLQKLYESAIAWGMRKVIKTEMQRDKLEEENQTLREEKRSLEQRVQELQSKLEFVTKNAAEMRAEREKQFNEERAVLKRQSQQIKTQLDQMLSTK